MTGPPDHTTRQTLAGIAGRLGAIIIRVFVNDDGFTDNVSNLKFIGEKSHNGPAMIGE
ncbi:hypothetical protein SDC9_212241 [bioreactor metagenome]|uniref:Uncharacterized protein n=1 Tax=bioreactor metagenome TaxID=1076179 RepID=A0A645JM34_9ZZZZ